MFTAMSTLVTTRLDAFIVDAFTSGEAPYPEAFATNAFVGEVVEGSVGISAHAYSRSERVNAGDGHCYDPFFGGSNTNRCMSFRCA